MLPNIFFNDKFEKLINELGILSFSSAFNLQELISIRDAAKGIVFGKPEEAAARAFRDLIVLNKRIPIEQRLELCFEKLGLLKVRHFNGEINVDLHLGVRETFERVLSEYTGKSFQENYFGALGEFGVIVPIENDTLRTIALAYLFLGKREELSPNDAALSFCVNVIAQNAEKYASSIAIKGQQIPRSANSAE